MTTMRAVRVHDFGGPEVLVVDQLERPEPESGEVLVQVVATCFNPPDGYLRSGYASLQASMQAMTGGIPGGMSQEEIRAAVEGVGAGLPYIPGSDAAGVIAALGPGVTGWAVGDPVLGLLRFPPLPRGGQTYAEYTTAPAHQLARRPEDVSVRAAAGLPMSGLTAYQYLIEHATLEAGSTVLINGAAGGVGHLAVQLAKDRDCEVTAVASGRHEQFLRDLGADRFVDYTTTDVSTTGRFDVVWDTVGGKGANRLTPLARDGGTLAAVFYGDYDLAALHQRGVRFVTAQVHSDGHQLAQLVAMAADGRLRVGIDSVYPLHEAADAHRRAEQGHLQGKIIIEPRPDRRDTTT